MQPQLECRSVLGLQQWRRGRRANRAPSESTKFFNTNLAQPISRLYARGEQLVRIPETQYSLRPREVGDGQGQVVLNNVDTGVTTDSGAQETSFSFRRPEVADQAKCTHSGKHSGKEGNIEPVPEKVCSEPRARNVLASHRRPFADSFLEYSVVRALGKNVTFCERHQILDKLQKWRSRRSSQKTLQYNTMNDVLEKAIKELFPQHFFPLVASNSC